MFSDKLISAIQSVSGTIASELEVEDDENFKSILAETTLDAGRLGMNGHKEAQEEMRIHVNAHGWTTVVREAEKHVCY